MKSSYLTVAFILAVFLLHSQTKLKTTLTADHKLIKYSKVFIIPPSGFRKNSNSIGYANNETGANVGAIQENKSIKSIINHLSEKYLLGKKYKIIEIKKYKINNMSAVWYELESEFYDRVTIKYILVIGNKKEHALIEAYCPKEYPLACIALKRSIFTTYYDTDSTYIKEISP